MRSRSVSRRSAPSSISVEGNLSRMRSRSAHREEERHSWVSQAAALPLQAVKLCSREDVTQWDEKLRPESVLQFDGWLCAFYYNHRFHLPCFSQLCGGKEGNLCECEQYYCLCWRVCVCVCPCPEEEGKGMQLVDWVLTAECCCAPVVKTWWLMLMARPSRLTSTHPTSRSREVAAKHPLRPVIQDWISQMVNEYLFSVLVY